MPTPLWMALRSSTSAHQAVKRAFKDWHDYSGQPVLPLNPDNGLEGPRSVVWIDEAWCIGCTLCIEACPVDAIIGTHKRMHTVIEAGLHRL